MKLFSFFFVLGCFYVSPLGAQQILGSGELKVEKQFYFVQINLNGKGAYNSWLDKGAGVTVVKPGLAQELGLKATGTARIGTAGRPVTSTSYANIDLSIEGYDLGPCTLEAFSIAHLEAYLELPLDGIIGSDLLHKHIVELNIDQHKIHFHQSATFAQQSSWKAIEITYLPSGHFGVPVGIQLDKKDALQNLILKVDSGFNNYVVFTGQAVQRYRSCFKIPGEMIGNRLEVRTKLIFCIVAIATKVKNS
jgi:predicted aspartyl protease